MVCHIWPLCVEVCSNYTQLVEHFYQERMLYFVTCLSGYTEIIIWFLSLILLMWYIIFIDLCMLNHFCITEINLTWSLYTIFLICPWIQFVNIFLRIFNIYSSWILVYSFLSLHYPYWLGHQGDAGLIKWAWESFLFFNFFGRVWEGLAFILL